MKRKTRHGAFGACHPAVNLLMFTAAIVLCMTIRSPAFVAVGVVAACACYLSERGASAWGWIGALCVMFAAITLINPLFNTMGSTVLLTWFPGRPYTLEALAYGASIAGGFVTMMLWFGCYNAVMTGDKLTYVFGRFAPATSLLFVMVLRLVPAYQRRLHDLGCARAALGKGCAEGSVRDRVQSGGVLLSSLATWAFDSALTTADSMRSRGFGQTKPATYALYRFDARDGALTAAMAVLLVVVAVCVAAGGASVEFVPRIIMPPATLPFAAGLAAYGLFCFIPLAVNVGEDLSWRISLSKI